MNAAQGVLANDTKGTPAATITANTQPAHGTLMLNASDGSFVYTPTSGYVGNDSFTYTLANGPGTFGTGSSTATVNITVNAATVTGLTTTAPTGSGSGNTGSASNPTLSIGGRLTLTTTATYNNGTSGTASSLMYTASNPGVATVDASGTVVALTAGTTTIMVTGPNNSRTMITITVTGAAGTGLMPLPQPMAHGAAATAVATPAPQPWRTRGDGHGERGAAAGSRAGDGNAQRPAREPLRETVATLLRDSERWRKQGDAVPPSSHPQHTYGRKAAAHRDGLHRIGGVKAGLPEWWRTWITRPGAGMRAEIAAASPFRYITVRAYTAPRRLLR